MGLYRLKPVKKQIIWGGHRLSEEFGIGRNCIAEAWVLAVHSEGVNRVESLHGDLSKIVGTEPFPVMIKLIDAADSLSVQVHPVKTEMWYVVDCEEGASLVYGLKDRFDKKAMRKALNEGRVRELLNYVPVHRGDVFFIPQGLVHAIGAGILIAEIQQNSNVTYRLYDYGRLQNGKPRQLHIDESMSVIRDFTDKEINARRYSLGRISEDCIANCEFFTAFRKTVNGEIRLTSEKKRFVSVVILDGEGKIGHFTFKKGESYLMNGSTAATLRSDNAEIIVTEY